jgi:hypothetical protein
VLAHTRDAHGHAWGKLLRWRDPATGEVWVERRRTIDQHYRATDVVAEIAQRQGRISMSGRIIAGGFDGAPCEVEALSADRFQVFGATVVGECLQQAAAQARAGP